MYGFSTTYTGIVKDSESGNPVKGVRVSLGYSNCVTTTDDKGTFVLSYEDSINNKQSVFSSETVDLQFTGGNAVLNFFAAPSAKKIGLFSLNGRCVYQKTIFPGDPVVKIPSISKGIYILKIDQPLNIATTFSVNTVLSGKSRAVVASMSSLQQQTSGVKISTEPLLFKHDTYYPESISMPTSGNSISISMKPDPRWPIFDETKIHSYNFTITKDDSLKMERDALLENFVPAQFKFNDSSIGQIGIRYKGSSYSLPLCFDSRGTRSAIAQCKKISLKLKFDKYSKSQSFFSMKRLNLHSLSADDTKMADILSYGLFREMGVISPRAAYVKVFINSVFRGLFLAVEEPDVRFAESRWPDDPDGNMYKEKWPVSDKPDYYKEGLVTNEDSEDNADVSKFISFYKAINRSTESDFVKKVSKYIDFNYFLRYIAVDRAIHNSDGMMTWYYSSKGAGNHNYFFYEETPVNGKIWQIPWDLHATFFRRDMIVDDMGAPEWNVRPRDCDPVKIWGGNVAIPAHCDKLIGMTADLLWDEYVKICEQMLATHFTESHLYSRLDFYKNLIKSIVPNDPYVDYNIWLWAVDYMREGIPILHSTYDDYIHAKKISNKKNQVCFLIAITN
jgi:spore coat protein CotH